MLWLLGQPLYIGKVLCCFSHPLYLETAMFVWCKTICKWDMHIYEVQDSNITNSYKQLIRVLCSFGAYETKTELKQMQIFFGSKWFKSIRRQASDHLAVTVSVPSDTDTGVNFFFSHSPAAHWWDLSTDNDIDTDSATDTVWHSLEKCYLAVVRQYIWESAIMLRSDIVLGKCYHC